MKKQLLIFLLFLALSAVAQAQTATPRASEKKSNAVSPVKFPAETRREKKESQNSTQQSGSYVRPNADERFKRYVKGIVGPIALARSLATAGIATARNSPEEWGKKWEGFGRRYASNLGRSAIKGTIVYTLDETLKVDSAFYRSNKKDFGSRFGNALISTFTARRPDGRRVIGAPRLIGTYATSIIAYETWYPKRYDYKDGLRSGTISLGFNAAFNVFKEFVWKK